MQNRKFWWVISFWFKTRQTLFIINSGDTLFDPFTVSVNKCGGSWNTIDEPCPRVCIPSKVKNMNVKVLNLMSRGYETIFLVQHETRECKCGLNDIWF